MSNLTIVIDDALLRSARIKALEQGTSVNEICRQAVERFVAQPAAPQAGDFMAQLSAITERLAKAQPHREPLGKLPSRNEMMEEAMAQRMPTLYAHLEKTNRRRTRP